MKKQITLRPQRVSDARRFFEILQNKKFVYFGVRPASVAEEIKFLKGNTERRRKNAEHNFTILFNGEAVGGCGIKINTRRPYIAEIGYFLDEKYWGKGIATKSVQLLEKIGFGKLKLKRIEILMNIRNKASWKVAIKAGYRKEGIMRKALKARGSNQLFDCYLYAKVKI